MPKKGQTSTPEGWSIIIRRWRNMVSRCHNPADVSYPKYSSRGIEVCKEWHCKKTFFNYVITYLGLPDESNERQTLDRIDNNKGYEPGNIRWATYTTQVRNKSDNVWIEYQGTNYLLHELGEKFNLKVSLLYDRLFKQKWNVEEALNTPKLLKSEKIKERSAKNEIVLTYLGRTQLLKYWCKEFNVNPALVRERLNQGWGIEKALTLLPDKGKAMKEKAKKYLYKEQLKTTKEIALDCGLTVSAIQYRIKNGWLGSSNGSQMKNELLKSK
jgi:hypothetical protein